MLTAALLRFQGAPVDPHLEVEEPCLYQEVHLAAAPFLAVAFLSSLE